MKDFDAKEIHRIQRRSNLAGILTGAGALVIFGVLAFSAWRAAELDSAIVQKEADLVQLEKNRLELRGNNRVLEEANQDLIAEIEPLKKSKEELIFEFERLAQTLEEQQANRARGVATGDGGRKRSGAWGVGGGGRFVWRAWKVATPLTGMAVTHYDPPTDMRQPANYRTHDITETLDFLRF